MKIFVLGASGTYGSGTAKLLANDERVAAIALAARNTDKLETLAAEIGPKAIIIQCDASDSSTLANQLAGYDVLVNATGYYQELIEPVLDAAIAAGVAYVDISEPTEALEKAFARKDAASGAGVTAMIGLGSTPGVTSMLGVHAAAQLDRCLSLNTGFVVAAGLYFLGDEAVLQQIQQRQTPLAVHQTIVEIFSDPVQVLENGKLITVDPMDAGRSVKLAGHGEARVYPIAMSTPHTLKDHLAGLESMAVCTAFLPDIINATVYQYAQRYKNGEADLQSVVSDMFTEIGRLPDDQKAAPEGLPAYMQWSVASGEKNGQTTLVRLGLKEPLSTVAAFAAAALALGKGDISKPGVWPVESCVEPLPFFDAVSQVQYGRPYTPESLLMELEST